MARVLGINHVALAVGDLDQALGLYAQLFDFELRGRSAQMAFIDMGDQFLALAEADSAPPDAERHFGLVVDDKESVRDAVRAVEGIEELSSRGASLDFRDPWGNHFQVVDYRDVQFERTPGVRRKLGIEGVEKSESASAEIDDRGLA